MASILLLTPQVPYPPRQGTALRNWGLLRGLAAAHDVSLLTFASSGQAFVPDPVLLQTAVRVATISQPDRGFPDRLKDLALSQKPDLVQRLANEPFRRQLDAWLARFTFDWAMVEGLELASYVAPCREAGLGIVFDAHNCEYLLQQRAARSDWRRPRRWPAALYSSIQWRRLRRYEAALCRRADLVVAVSEADAAALRSISGGVVPLVIPNGIDVETYAQFGGTVALPDPTFVFTGTMDFRPNVDGVLWFADRAWPRIREALPGASFYIVGQRPHPRLDRLKEVPGIEITGSVPDTRPYIRAASVYVVPLLVGGGTRLKLLESTAMGKAIVATPLAAEGFVEPQRAMVLAETPEAFADACVSLATDPAVCAEWGQRARAYARDYDWAKLLPPLLARLASRHRPGPQQQSAISGRPE